MTLSAFLGRERLDLTTFSDNDWYELRKEKHPPLRCTGCGAPMHTRELSRAERLPLRIFAHNPGHGHGTALCANESAEHDALKATVATVARKAGWLADVEVTHDDNCRSDVVATHPATKKRHAFEVQFAPLNLADAIDRHERYEDAVGNCTWLHTRDRQWARRIPSLKVDDTATTVVDGIIIDGSETPAPPQPVEAVVARVLKPNPSPAGEWLDYVWIGEEFGFYMPRYARRSGPLPRRRRRRTNRTGVIGATTDCHRERVPRWTLCDVGIDHAPMPCGCCWHDSGRHEHPGVVGPMCPWEEQWL